MDRKLPEVTEASNKYKWMYLTLNKLVNFLMDMDCEVVLLTLPPKPVLEEGDERKALLLKFNELIRNMAENKGLRLIDIYTVFMDGPVINEKMFEKFYYGGKIDKLHWNFMGMEKIIHKIKTEL
ncbi:uncharacterized protein LOC134527356 [Bacillus rossius redtenbacheri]|uniref:uncharacterized protein LOC134527356 n=1 Tax=Bacillus rossius redtenbacheri TaxID=93214 RepID=UPI002FDD2D1F